jgi:hypothetical protein
MSNILINILYESFIRCRRDKFDVENTYIRKLNYTLLFVEKDFFQMFETCRSVADVFSAFQMQFSVLIDRQCCVNII